MLISSLKSLSSHQGNKWLLRGWQRICHPEHSEKSGAGLLVPRLILSNTEGWSQLREQAQGHSQAGESARPPDSQPRSCRPDPSGARAHLDRGFWGRPYRWASQPWAVLRRWCQVSCPWDILMLVISCQPVPSCTWAKSSQRVGEITKEKLKPHEVGY